MPTLHKLTTTIELTCAVKYARNDDDDDDDDDGADALFSNHQ